MIFSFLLLLGDPCLEAMEKLKQVARFQEAVFVLEWHAGELDRVEVDMIAAKIYTDKRWRLTDNEKMKFLALWDRVR